MRFLRKKLKIGILIHVTVNGVFHSQSSYKIHQTAAPKILWVSISKISKLSVINGRNSAQNLDTWRSRCVPCRCFMEVVVIEIIEQFKLTLMHRY